MEEGVGPIGETGHGVGNLELLIFHQFLASGSAFRVKSLEFRVGLLNRAPVAVSGLCSRNLVETVSSWTVHPRAPM